VPQPHLASAIGVEPTDLVDAAKSVAELRAAAPAPSKHRLNATVAISVALLATFMAICKVKDDNIVQAMQQAQADKIDHWAYYQARTLRLELAETTALQLELARDSAPHPAKGYDEAIAHYRKLAADQTEKRAQVRQQAEQDQKTYDALNYRDDQFDLADAALAIAVAMLAVTALTEMWALYWFTLVPMLFGVVMGTAGLAGWALHPDSLIRLLS
jgi:hypothetical protein